MGAWYLELHLERFAPQLATILVATLMAVYGERINRILKRKLKKWPVPARFLGFMFFWIFFFPLIVVFCSELAIRTFAGIPDPWVAPLGFLMLSLIGLGAYLEKQI